MTDIRNRVAVVTGANTGLGFETSLGLAKRQYAVVLACRSESKAREAAARIRKEVPSSDLETLPLDLIDRDSVSRFAVEFSKSHNHLDLLVNNAGVMGPPQTITANGLELQFDANHIGHFLLTSLLFDKLDQSYETRVVNVSSLAGKLAEADIFFDNLNFEGTYNDGPGFMGLPGMLAYSQSKLANILFTMALRDRCAAAGKRVKAVVAHPGASNTDLSRNMSIVIRVLAPIIVRFMDVSTPVEGARSLLMAALDPSVEAGQFIGPTGRREQVGAPGNCELPPKAHDKGLCERLWALSEELVGQRFAI